VTRTLTLDEAAEVLKTSVETVSDCIHNRNLPAARIGRAYVLVEADVIEWLRAQYGNWRQQPCGYISAKQEALGGSILATSQASALDAALAPRTTPRRRNTPPRLRAISGASADSAKPRE
jgi:excisionase family DNA binding protein